MAAAAQVPGWRRLGLACLLHWHLCSLDAPTVAVVWAITLERLAKVPWHGSELLVLGLGTWIVYVLDRVLDGSSLERSKPEAGLPLAGLGQLKERHLFHTRHRRILLRLCCLAGILLATLCVRLPERLITFYLVLGLPVMLYAVRVHRRLLWPLPTSDTGRGQWKEAGVACLFTAAVAGPALVRAQRADRLPVLSASVLLAALCWFNCSLISHAEAASFHTRRQRYLQIAGCALALASAIMANSGARVYHSLPVQTAQASVAMAILISSLLLVLLLSLPNAPRRLRILADVGLLTPLLLLIPLH